MPRDPGGSSNAARCCRDEADLDALATASDPHLPEYPYGMIRRIMDVTVWDDLGLRLEREYRGLGR